MRTLPRRQQWAIVLLGLPIATILSTFIVSQTQLSRFVPQDMPLQPAVWATMQLSVASGLLWLLWRDRSQTPNWHILLRAFIEGIVIVGTALGLGWYVQIIEISWQITSESVLTALMLILPLAWWSMAEERLLRVEMGHLLTHTPMIMREVVLLLLGWVVQISILTINHIFALIVVVLTEGLSIITWSISARYDLTWARRWSWRWLLVAVAGVSSTGFNLGTPTPIVITTEDPLLLTVIVVAAFAIWVSMSALLHHPAD